jgi:hypothetical protein
MREATITTPAKAPAKHHSTAVRFTRPFGLATYEVLKNKTPDVAFAHPGYKRKRRTFARRLEKD